MIPESYKVLVITLSDRAFRGEYEDLSGPRVEELLQKFLEENKLKCTTERVVLPDSSEMLHEKLEVATGKYDIIFTTGGTGIGPRDITVETVKPFLTKEIPGIMEYIRVKYGEQKPSALLSRGVAGIAGKCLIYTLPGSIRAVQEYLTEIFRTLIHTIEMLHGVDSHKKH